MSTQQQNTSLMISFQKLTFISLCLFGLFSAFSPQTEKQRTQAVGLLVSDSMLQIDSSTFRIGQRSASLGDEIQQWVALLGPYSRAERKRTGSFLTGKLDSVFVWDALGISLLADEEDGWRVGEVMVFFLNKHTPGIDTAALYYCQESQHYREMYEKTPNYIEEWSQSFGGGDEKVIEENRTYLTEQNRGNLSLSSIYPMHTFRHEILLQGSLFQASWDIQKINEGRRAKALPLFSYLMSLKKLDPENSLKYLMKEEWKKDKNYLSTQKTLDGIYTLSGKMSQGTGLLVTNGQIEFILIQ